MIPPQLTPFDPCKVFDRSSLEYDWIRQTRRACFELSQDYKHLLGQIDKFLKGAGWRVYLPGVNHVHDPEVAKSGYYKAFKNRKHETLNYHFRDIMDAFEFEQNQLDQSHFSND